jgi:hypothetical protein
MAAPPTVPQGEAVIGRSKGCPLALAPLAPAAALPCAAPENNHDNGRETARMAVNRISKVQIGLGVLSGLLFLSLLQIEKALQSKEPVAIAISK